MAGKESATLFSPNMTADDASVITEADMDEYWKARDLTEIDEFDFDDWREDACCPDEWTAARLLCGCRGSGWLPEWVRRTLDVE
jgi:hypothetical protein